MQRVLFAIAIAAAYAGISTSSAARSTSGSMTSMMGEVLFPTMIGTNKTQ